VTDNQTTRKSSRARTSTLTVEDMRKALEIMRAAQAEEHVLRMRYGVAEPGSARLAMKGEGNAEVRAKLAMIEMELLGQAGGDERPTRPTPNRDKIVGKLKRLR
jgi:hypothetical protein